MGRCKTTLTRLAAASSILIGGAAAVLAGGFGMPPNVSVHGQGIDQIYNIILVITTVAFVLVEVTLVVFLFKYRKKKGGKAHPAHGSNAMEITWTSVTALILLFILIMSQRVWAQIRYTTPPEDSFRVEVLGEQFAWNIRYPGPDGQFGQTRSELIAVDNPWGIDPEDPAGNDDITAINQLHLPIGRPVHVRLSSKDVLHSFFLPHLRVKQDALPGRKVDVWFEIDPDLAETVKDENLELACAELCGLGHYRMRGYLTLLSESEMQQWLAEQNQ